MNAAGSAYGFPWFDIDWVIRWRLERYCFPEIFVKPYHWGTSAVGRRVAEFRCPGPDPGPVELREAGLSLDHLWRRSSGAIRRVKILLLPGRRLPSAETVRHCNAFSNQPAYLNPVPPPTSAKLRESGAPPPCSRRGRTEGALVRGKADREYQLDLNRYVGPFPSVAVRMGNRGRTGADPRSAGYHILGYPRHGW